MVLDKVNINLEVPVVYCHSVVAEDLAEVEISGKRYKAFSHDTTWGTWQCPKCSFHEGDDNCCRCTQPGLPCGEDGIFKYPEGEGFYRLSETIYWKEVCN